MNHEHFTRRTSNYGYIQYESVVFGWIFTKKVINIMLIIYWKNMVTNPYFCRLILNLGRKSSILKIEKK